MEIFLNFVCTTVLANPTFLSQPINHLQSNKYYFSWNSVYGASEYTIELAEKVASNFDESANIF